MPIGCLLAIGVVGALIVFLWRRSRENRKTKASQRHPSKSEPQPLQVKPIEAAAVGRGPTYAVEQAIIPEQPVLSAPGNVTATGGNGEVVIRWNDVQGATSYHVYWSTSPDINKRTGNRMANVTSPFKHSSLNNEDTYYYVVTAIDGQAESAESDRVTAIPVPPQAPVSSFTWQIEREN